MFLLIGIMFSNEGFAQWGTGVQSGAGNEVMVGSTYDYRVTAVGGNSYVWNIVRLTGTGSAPVLSNASTNQVSVEWTSAGTYRVEVVETVTATGCNTTKVFNVDVIGNTSAIVYANVTNCANDIPALTTDFTSNVTFTGGTAPWTITYNVGGGDVTETLTDVGGTSKTFLHTFTNKPGDVPQLYTITIKDAHDAYGMKPGNATDITTNNIDVAYTMNEVPNTTKIEHN